MSELDPQSHQAGRRRSLRERTTQARSARFVGRIEILEQIEELASAVEPSKNVLDVHGVGGIGKSTLLNEASIRCSKAGAITCLANIESADTPIAILSAWRTSLGEHQPQFDGFDRLQRAYLAAKEKARRLGESVTDGLTNAVDNFGPVGAFITGTVGEDRIKSWFTASMSAEETDLINSSVEELTAQFLSGLATLVGDGPGAVLLLDTYEQASPLVQGWVRKVLLAASSFDQRWIFIVAGREPISTLDEEWASPWGDITMSIEVRVLAVEDSQAFLTDQRPGLSPDQIANLAVLSGGLPWALELIVDLPEVTDLGPGEFAAGPGREIVRRLLSQLRSDDPDVRTLLQAAACFETFDQDLLAATAMIDAEPAIGRLLDYSFVEKRIDLRWSLHEVLRDLLRLVLEAERPETWRALNERASAALRERHRRSAQWSNTWFELLREICLVEIRLGIGGLGATLESLPLGVRPDLAPEVAAVVRSIRSADARLSPTESQSLDVLEGQLAVAYGDVSTARSLLGRVIAYAPRASHAYISAAVSLIEALHHAGEPVAALNVAQMAAEEVEVLEAKLLLQTRIAEMHGVLGRLDESEIALAIVLADIGSVRADIRSSIALLVSHVLIFRADLVRSTEALKLARAASIEAGNDFDLYRTDSATAWLATYTADISEGWRSAVASSRSAREFRDRLGQVLNGLTRAELLRIQGEPRSGLAWNRRSLQLSDSDELRLYHAIGQAQAGFCQLDLEKPTDAREHFDVALEIEVSIDEKVSLGQALFGLACTYDIGSRERMDHLGSAAEVWSGSQSYMARWMAVVAAAEVTGLLDESLEVFLSAVRSSAPGDFPSVLAGAAVRWVSHRDHQPETRGPALAAAIELAAESGVAILLRTCRILEPAMSLVPYDEATVSRIRSEGVKLMQNPRRRHLLKRWDASFGDLRALHLLNAEAQ